MPGLAFANELISRDEGLHCQFGCHLHNTLLKPLDPAIVTDIVRGAVAVEKAFIIEAIPVEMIGMNAKGMGQ